MRMIYVKILAKQEEKLAEEIGEAIFKWVSVLPSSSVCSAYLLTNLESSAIRAMVTIWLLLPIRVAA